jgi:hypothetical protein
MRFWPRSILMRMRLRLRRRRPYTAGFVGATADEISAAISTVRRVLEHPVLRRAVRTGDGGLRRETPIMLALDDGRLVEGVSELAFRDDAPEFAGWTS